MLWVRSRSSEGIDLIIAADGDIADPNPCHSPFRWKRPITFVVLGSSSRERGTRSCAWEREGHAGVLQQSHPYLRIFVSHPGGTCHLIWIR